LIRVAAATLISVDLPAVMTTLSRVETNDLSDST